MNFQKFKVVKGLQFNVCISTEICNRPLKESLRHENVRNKISKYSNQATTKRTRNFPLLYFYMGFGDSVKVQPGT